MKVGVMLPSTETNFRGKTPVSHRAEGYAVLGGSQETVKRRTSRLSLYRTRFIGRYTNSLVTVLSHLAIVAVELK
jgi:hypothetical protein